MNWVILSRSVDQITNLLMVGSTIFKNSKFLEVGFQKKKILLKQIERDLISFGVMRESEQTFILFLWQ